MVATLVEPEVFPRLCHLWMDGAYGGTVDFAARYAGITVEVVKRPADATGFLLLPRRWVVERTFGWFGRCRRLSKDYEALPATEEAFLYLAMISLMLHRLAPEDEPPWS